MKGSPTHRFRTAVILAALMTLVGSAGYGLSTGDKSATGSRYPTLVQSDTNAGLVLRQTDQRPQTEATPPAIQTQAQPIQEAPPQPIPPTQPVKPPAAAQPIETATVQQAMLENQQLDNRMATIERLLEQSRQQDRSMLMMMITITLIVSGVTGLTGIGAVIAVVILQARWINRVSESALTHAATPAVPPALGWGTQGLPEPAQTTPGIQTSRQQFSEAVSNLRAQISAMENGGAFASDRSGPGAPVVTADTGDNEAYEVTKLVEKGAQLLDVGRADRALVCFDQAAVLAPESSDIHLKRARSLEQLQRDIEALDAYDRVLAIDSSLVAANLGKAGILNRLERYNEALECYEKALGHASAPRRPVV